MGFYSVISCLTTQLVSGGSYLGKEEKTTKPEVTCGGLQLILNVSKALFCGALFEKHVTCCQMAGVCRFCYYDGQILVNNNFYFMASSASGQDESNPALSLATQAGKVELSCPRGTTRRVPHEKFPRN